MAGNDPSSGIHGDLLPHIHLVSTYRYPVIPQLHTPEVVKWLTNAPKIARDSAPFYWTYIDAPQDGTIFLTWQPLARRNVEFASDGYIWPQPEQSYRQEVGNGLYLEILLNKCGFRQGDPVTSHSRRRFRLGAAANSPQIDPGLWLVHYGPAEKNDRLQTNMIQLPPQIQQNLAFRQQLLSMGAIVRKEFMLSDRVNWPHIPLPGPRGYTQPLSNRGVPQTMAYPPQAHHGVGPSSKRRGVAQVPQGPGHPGQQPMIGGMPATEFGFDDDEDTMKGDAFDHITPRDVSMQRFQQNHELMEEVLSSPYRMGQIVMSDLGLGLRGELASLTNGIFESQGSRALEEMPKKPYVGHLDPGLADEFRRRVHEKMESTNAEIEQMKADHEKRMAKLRGGTGLKRAEAELRSLETGVEGFGLEAGPKDDGEDEGSGWPKKQDTKTMDEILAQVEAALGKHIVVVGQVTRVQEGGYQQPAPEPEPPLPPVSEEPAPAAPMPDPSTGMTASLSRQPSQAGSQHSGIMIGDSDIDMGGTAAGLLDQMHTGFSSASTPANNFPTPQPALSAPQSNAATPANFGPFSPNPAQTQPAAPTTAADDVNMEDAEASKPAGDTASDQGTASGDWVVVPRHGGAAVQAADGAATSAPQQEQTSTGTPSATTGATTTSQQQLAGATSSKPGSAAATPGGGLGSFEGDNNDFSSLGDLDTAGDALAGYDPPSVVATGVELGGEGGLDMDMEDSAFGDAFHGVDSTSAGNTPADAAF